MDRPFKIGQDVIAEVKRGEIFIVLPGVFRQYGVSKKGEAPLGIVDLGGRCVITDLAKIKTAETETVPGAGKSFLALDLAGRVDHALEIAPIDAPVEFSPSLGEPGN